MAPLGLASTAHALEPRALVFPRDRGAHPELRTEWWYVTGSAHAGGREFGFQVTFFRSRVDAALTLRSRFAARQLVFAHAAITDLEGGRLLHDQQIARAGFGIAEAALEDTRLTLRGWRLHAVPGGYQAQVRSDEFALALTLRATQPVLLQGAAGLSRKGPLPSQASYYYSEPQLTVGGRLELRGRGFDVQGRAWLDHEWSEALMAPEAVGWDWIGMNLDDGGALTAFRLRRADSTPLWDGGSWRDVQGRTRIAAPGETSFAAVRRWRSPRSGASYPVQWRISTLAGRFTVKAALDDQELDSRASTGAIYWEGLSDLLDESGRRVGRGYLEMTGYAERLRI